MNVSHRVMALALAFGAAVPTWADQSAPAAGDPAKQQVVMFEVGLRNAVEIGGARFADRVAKTYPGIFMSPGEPPSVRGLVLRDEGVYLFTVEVPEFLQTSLQIFNWIRGRPGQPRERAPQPVASSGSGTTSATSTMEADPMTVSPVVGGPDFDLNREYTSDVKGALIDAMLENSGVLPLGPNETLIVVTTGRNDTTASPFYRSGARELILRIKASDLADYRRGTIDRTEVLRRVKETRF